MEAFLLMKIPPSGGIFLFWKRDSFLESQDGNGGRLDFLLYSAGLFVTEMGGRGVFFEGVQKYFVKMEKTWLNWLNFSKTRDARGPGGPC